MTPVRRNHENAKDVAQGIAAGSTSKQDTETIRRWQGNAKRQISRLKRQGFATVILDESVFVNAPSKGCRYRSPVGEPVTVPYDGRRPRTAAYGAMTTDGRKFFRTYDSFDGRTFLKYFKGLCRH